MRCFLAMRLASFSRKKAARARCSRGGASMCEVRSGCAKVERGACGPRWHGCSFVSYAAATPPGDSMHISHNLARGPPSSEIAISRISRDLPHAHLPQSRPGTTVPGDCNLTQLKTCRFAPAQRTFTSPGPWALSLLVEKPDEADRQSGVVGHPRTVRWGGRCESHLCRCSRTRVTTRERQS